MNGKGKFFGILCLMAFTTGCEAIMDELTKDTKPCPAECATQNPDKSPACGDCSMAVLEGEWSLSINIPGRDPFTGRAKVCCGEVSLYGDLGMGVDDCTLTGTGCAFQVRCGLSSLTGCPSGDVIMDVTRTGGDLAGHAEGCGMNGELVGHKKTQITAFPACAGMTEALRSFTLPVTCINNQL